MNSGGPVQAQGGAPAPPVAGKSIRAARVAPLLQTRDAHNVFDEMPKPPGHCAAVVAHKKLQDLLFFSFSFR
ncbi:unnamed protein product [Prunus armeniaca]